MKRFILFGFLSSGLGLNAQIISKMPLSTPELSNPAYTGLFETSRLSLFTGFGYNYNHQYLGYSQYSEKLHGGFGGYLRTLNANYAEDLTGQHYFGGMTYAYQNKIGENWHYSLGLGIEFGANTYTNTNQSFAALRYGGKLGGVLYNDHFLGGLTYNFQPDIYRGSNISATLGYKFTPFADQSFSFTPIITYESDFKHYGLSVRGEIGYKNVFIGAGYYGGRANFSAGLDLKRIRINYNIGNVTSGLKYSTHEIAIQLKFPQQSKKVNSRQFNHRLF